MKLLIIVLFCSLSIAFSVDDSTAFPDEWKFKLPELQAPPPGVNTPSSNDVTTASASNVILVVLIIIVIVAMVAGGVFYYKKIQQLGPSHEALTGKI